MIRSDKCRANRGSLIYSGKKERKGEEKGRRVIEKIWRGERANERERARLIVSNPSNHKSLDQTFLSVNARCSMAGMANGSAKSLVTRRRPGPPREISIIKVDF